MDGPLGHWPSDQETEEMDVSCESQGVRYCVICEYEAEDMYDLEAHTWSEHEDVEIIDHSKRTLEERDCNKESLEHVSIHQSLHQNDNQIGCNFCGENFETRRILMEHKKRVHLEKVALCWNFSAGKCDFSNDSCWFSHINNLKGMANFKCKICQNVSETQNELHYQEKREHARSIPQCRNASKGTCFYGDEKCWFQHNETEHQEKNLNTNCEITSKLFDMMDIFTDKITKIEKQMEMPKQ